MSSKCGELFIELIAIAIAYIIAAVGTWIIWKFIDARIGVRVQEETENQSLDISKHSQEGDTADFMTMKYKHQSQKSCGVGILPAKSVRIQI